MDTQKLAEMLRAKILWLCLKELRLDRTCAAYAADL